MTEEQMGGTAPETEAILRSVGARPAAVFALLTMEGLAVTLLGALFVKQLFAGLLPADQQDSYIAGLILLRNV